MSRIGRMPISLPSNVEVTLGEGNLVTVKGPKGTLTQKLSDKMTITKEENVIHVTRPNDAKENRALHGLTRTLLNNMVIGVTEGYKKELDVNGVGYRVAKEGKKLNMNIGYSHPVIVEEIDGITIDVPSPAAPTSRRSASSLPRSEGRDPRNPTRARESNILTRSSAARKARPA